MDELRRLMVEHHQRYLPVMDGATLLGVVSFHDVAKAVLEEQSFENRMLKNYIRNSARQRGGAVAHRVGPQARPAAARPSHLHERSDPFGRSLRYIEKGRPGWNEAADAWRLPDASGGRSWRIL
jgi:CBS domain.